MKKISKKFQKKQFVLNEFVVINTFFDALFNICIFYMFLIVLYLFLYHFYLHLIMKKTHTAHMFSIKYGLFESLFFWVFDLVNLLFLDLDSFVVDLLVICR